MTQKPEKSAAAKAAEKAKADYAAAKGRHDANANATNKAAMDKAGEAMKTAVASANAEKFIQVGTPRVKKARHAIRQLAKLANGRTYNPGPNGAAKLIQGVREAVAELEAAFNTTGNAKAQSDAFSL